MSEHVARIAKVDSVSPINGADRIQTAYVLGVQVIVSKEVKIGDIGVLFDGELALSDNYLKFNNLYREKKLNSDKEKTGYFDKNRKVRVQKFLKVRSEGLFMPVESLSFTGYDIDNLKIGDAFDLLNNVRVCEKYISEKTRRFLASNQIKKIKNIEAPIFKEHVDTKQLSYYIDAIPKGALISIEHKWHGTSGRVSKTKVVKRVKEKTEENVFFRSLNKNIKKIRYEDKEISQYEFVAGSRRVTLFEDKDSEKEGFHGSEKYRFDILNEFKPYLSEGLTIFFEIVGFVNGGPIMGAHEMDKLKDKEYLNKYGSKIIYKYGCPSDKYRIKVYRITLTTNDGESIDFTPQQIEDWCEKRGFLASKTLIPRFLYDGDKEKLMETVLNLADRPDKLCEDYVDPSHINEGVVVRADFSGLTPLFLKYKSFVFRVLEGIAKENGDFDAEEAS